MLCRLLILNRITAEECISVFIQTANIDFTSPCNVRNSSQWCQEIPGKPNRYVLNVQPPAVSPQQVFIFYGWNFQLKLALFGLGCHLKETTCPYFTQLSSNDVQFETPGFGFFEIKVSSHVHPDLIFFQNILDEKKMLMRISLLFFNRNKIMAGEIEVLFFFFGFVWNELTLITLCLSVVWPSG